MQFQCHFSYFWQISYFSVNFFTIDTEQILIHENTAIQLNCFKYLSTSGNMYCMKELLLVRTSLLLEKSELRQNFTGMSLFSDWQEN